MKLVECISLRESNKEQLTIGKLYWIDDKNKYIDSDNDVYVQVYLDETKKLNVGTLLESHFRDIIILPYKESKVNLSEFYFRKLRERFGYNEKNDYHDEEILKNNTKHELLEEILSYEGIQGYSNMIITLINEIYGIDLNSISN